MTDESLNLLPCAHCGGAVVLHHGHGNITYVLCGEKDDGSDGCGAITSFRPNLRGMKTVAAWNRRTPQPDKAIKDAGHVHSCSLYCDRPDCIKAQRDQMRDNYQPDKAGVGFVMVPRDALLEVLRISDRKHDAWDAVKSALATPPPPGAGEDRLAKYDELLFAVCRKWPGESRHETALRYIRQAESQDHGPAQSAKQGEINGTA